MFNFVKKLLVVSLAVFALSLINSQAVTGSDSQKTPVSDITLSTPLSDITFSQSVPGTAASSPSSESTAASTFFLFLRMLLSLATVAAIIYGVYRFLKKTNKIQSDDEQFLRKVSQVTLAPGKTAQVITLLDHAYIVGVSDDSVNLIAEVQDKELIDAMNLYADKTSASSKPKKFEDVLNLFMNGKKSGNTERPRHTAFDETIENINNGNGLEQEEDNA